MPLVVRGTTYPLPAEDGRTGPTGREIDTVESYFGVDWYDLMAAVEREEEGAPPRTLRPGCTRNRAMYALAWLVMHRADPSLTLEAVMDEYGRDELRFTLEDDTPAAQAAAVPTPAGDEGTEPAATS